MITLSKQMSSSDALTMLSRFIEENENSLSQQMINDLLDIHSSLDAEFEELDDTTYELYNMAEEKAAGTI